MVEIDNSTNCTARRFRRWHALRELGPAIVAAATLLLTGACSGEPAATPADLPAPARAVIAERSAARFERDVDDDSDRGIRELEALADASVAAPDGERRQLQDYVVEAARARGGRLARRGAPWSAEDVTAYLALMFLDPPRFAEDAELRSIVLQIVPRALPPDVPGELRDELLQRMTTLDGLSFEDSAAIEVAWGAAQRRGSSRQVPFEPGAGRIIDDLEGRIVASVFSLPSRWIEPLAAAELLRAVRRSAPQRALVVLSDLEQRDALRELAGEANVEWITTYGQSYSPWPRDPFSFLRRPDAGVLLLVRPNVQRLREVDVTMGQALIQGLPRQLDDAWGGVVWARSPVPFHNGQILPLPRALWISVHSVEVRILELLEESRVPVERLSDDAGWRRYVDAAETAADELAALYDRPVAWVHPLDPATAPDAAFLAALGGGAGYDLDSLVTPLLTPRGDLAALVADVDAGLEVLRQSSSAELDRFARQLGIRTVGDELRRAVEASQRGPAARGLDAFLELVAGQLRGAGVAVSRLPLVWLPPELVPRLDAPLQQPFLITWNNVVQQRLDGGGRAEGFSGLLPAGDVWAGGRFAANGYDLELLPPLVESIVRNGGYRCASQHLRE